MYKCQVLTFWNVTATEPKIVPLSKTVDGFYIMVDSDQQARLTVHTAGTL